MAVMCDHEPADGWMEHVVGLAVGAQGTHSTGLILAPPGRLLKMPFVSAAPSGAAPHGVGVQPGTGHGTGQLAAREKQKAAAVPGPAVVAASKAADEWQRTKEEIVCSLSDVGPPMSSSPHSHWLGSPVMLPTPLSQNRSLSQPYLSPSSFLLGEAHHAELDGGLCPLPPSVFSERLAELDPF